MKKQSLKQHNRALALVLATAMGVSLLTACGGGSSSSETTAGTTAAAQETTAAGTADSTAAAETETAGEPMTLTWYNINPPYEDDSWGEQEFEKLFGVDVQIVRAESDDELSVMLASGTIPDVLFVGSIDDVSKYQKLGILATVTEDEIREHMPEYYEMCVEEDPHFFTYATIDGKSYGITKYNVMAGIPQPAVIRADWLKACGFTEVPTTIEELEEVFDAFVNKDPDGNGLNDTYALTSGSDKENGKRFFSSIFGAYGINPFCWVEKDGGVQFGFATDECKEALKLLHSWYEKGYIDPEFVTDEVRSSGIDEAYKFANGKVGYADGFAYDDYGWDNDGHVNAKWVAANPSWQEFFAENEGDIKKMYSTANVTDFSDDMIDPYYIVIPEMVGPAGEDSAYYAQSPVSGFVLFGVQLEEDREKMYKVMEILERQATEEEIAVNEYGPEGYVWEWNEDKTEREWIENYSDKPDYHPQGQIMGNGLCLWPFYNVNSELLSVVGGVRMTQRYDTDLPMFNALPGRSDAVKTALTGAAEHPDLVYDYPLEYIVQAIRGDVDIDATWDSTIETWNANGGQAMTDEANEWYSGILGN